ncbi:hypothetical protein [Kibdelosporangium aridum]|nr:hypothetical protein [Kibdelosporangium aridum]
MGSLESSLLAEIVDSRVVRVVPAARFNGTFAVGPAQIVAGTYGKPT